MNSTSENPPALVIPGFYTHVVLPFAIVWLLSGVLKKQFAGNKTIPLNGPGNPSILFGWYRRINESEDPSALYEGWALKYGPAFRLPGGFGSSRIVICDPRANAHFYSKETFGYVQNKLSRVFIEILVSTFRFLLTMKALSLFSLAEDCFGLRGRVIGGLFCVIDSRYSRFDPFRCIYYRQRKALSPAFSNAAIRKLTPTFYDTAYKVNVVRPSLRM